jgi:hypothetical protein
VTTLSPIKFGSYFIERRLSEIFRASCPRCGWVGNYRMDLADVLSDLKVHIDKSTNDSAHEPPPMALSYA